MDSERVGRYATELTLIIVADALPASLAKSKQSTPEDTLEELLDRVSNTREDIVKIERALERIGETSPYHSEPRTGPPGDRSW